MPLYVDAALDALVLAMGGRGSDWWSPERCEETTTTTNRWHQSGGVWVSETTTRRVCKGGGDGKGGGQGVGGGGGWDGKGSGWGMGGGEGGGGEWGGWGMGGGEGGGGEWDGKGGGWYSNWGGKGGDGRKGDGGKGVGCKGGDRKGDGGKGVGGKGKNPLPGVQIPPAIASQKDIRLYDPTVPADFNAQRYVSDTLVARGVSQVREVWQLELGNPFAGMQGAITVKVARHEPAGAASSSNPAEGKVDVVGAASAASSSNPAEGKVEDPGAGRWRAHQEHWLQNVMLCRFELRNQCRKGSQCNYAHSLQELRKPNWPTVETDWPTRRTVKPMFAVYARKEHAAGLARTAD